MPGNEIVGGRPLPPTPSRVSGDMHAFRLDNPNNVMDKLAGLPAKVSSNVKRLSGSLKTKLNESTPYNKVHEFVETAAHRVEDAASTAGGKVKSAVTKIEQGKVSQKFIKTSQKATNFVKRLSNNFSESKPEKPVVNPQKAVEVEHWLGEHVSKPVPPSPTLPRKNKPLPPTPVKSAPQLGTGIEHVRPVPPPLPPRPASQPTVESAKRMSKEDFKIEILNEMYQSEKSYKEQLDTYISILKEFNSIHPNAKAASTLAKLTDIQSAQAPILALLGSAARQKSTEFLEPNILDHYIDVHQTYINKYKNELAIIEKISTSEKYSLTLLDLIEKKNSTLSRNSPLKTILDGGLISLGAFAIAPIQRLPKYPLLLYKLIENLPPDDPSLPKLRNLLTGLQTKLTIVNAQTEKLKRD